ncbi:MAG TPA: ATP-binding protein [Candidatus Mediterraneibacter merdipullorum]|nr:ATP-binding protein [Candidatus Mediterraneibacter merdipullorum]
MIKRNRYLDQISPFIDKDLIKVLIGLRRSGKTILLSQIRDILLARGVPEKNIIEINFESRRFKKLEDADAFYQYVMERAEQAGGRVYLFFDEIQHVKEWHSVIPSFRSDLDCDIYVTGSNSKLLSGGLATYMAGRYVSFHVYPFVLSEIREFYEKNSIPYRREQLFADYLKYGGLPMRLLLPDEHSVRTYLEDVYDSVVMKDILSRHAIRNENLLRKLLEFLLDNIGNPFSARSISRTLKAAGLSTTVETLLNYIDKLQEGMILSKAERYDIKGKSILASTEKYYAGDIGLRNINKASEQTDSSKLFENVVYLEMLSRGYDVKVGKLGSQEIDFVCYKGQKKLYIQVAYVLTEDCIAREFGNLENIDDNYPKYVISSDIVDMSRNGIIHYNIIDFLLDKHEI